MNNVISWLEKLAFIVAICCYYMCLYTGLHCDFIHWCKSSISDSIRAASSLKIERQSLANMTKTRHQKASS